MSSAVVVAAFSGQAVAAGPSLSDVLGNSGITVGGTVDASYDWSPNDGVAGHQFDTEKDAFSLHQVNLSASKAFDGGIGATLNVLAGDDAEVTSGEGDEFDVLQGFVSYSAGNFTVQGGRFVTLAGMEVINSAGNLNASRSGLFFLQPLRHEGVRGTYKINDLAAVTLGVVNSAFGGSRFDENNSDVTVEAQLALTPAKNLSIYLTGYSGNEDDSGDGIEDPFGDANLRTDVLDLVVNFNLNEMVYLGLNADYINTEDAVEVDGGGENGPIVTSGGGSSEIYGVAGYVGVKFLPKWRVALRSEYISADAGLGQGDTYVRTNTVTLAYAVTDNLEVLAEARADKVSGASNTPATVDEDGNVVTFPGNEQFFPIDGPNREDDQYTATLKAILKF